MCPLASRRSVVSRWPLASGGTPKTAGKAKNSTNQAAFHCSTAYSAPPYRRLKPNVDSALLLGKLLGTCLGKLGGTTFERCPACTTEKATLGGFLAGPPQGTSQLASRTILTGRYAQGKQAKRLVAYHGAVQFFPRLRVRKTVLAITAINRAGPG
jgi:hypothetical protein